MITTEQLIQQYHLQSHLAGGWYKETYKSEETISTVALPGRFGGARSFSTAIYFLLEQGNFSAFNRIKSDECWHFYAGGALDVYVLQQDGSLDIIHLGNDIRQLFQFAVPANCWFASRPAAGSHFCFVGCTVAPGFDFADFEMPGAAILASKFSHHENIIKPLCR